MATKKKMKMTKEVLFKPESEATDEELSDGFNIMANQFERQMLQMWRSADSITVFRDLSSREKLDSFLAGSLCALIQVAFAGIAPQHRDQFMQYMREEALSCARNMVEAAEMVEMEMKGR